MTNDIDNMRKYANYKEQMGRLKKAISSRFYLEAIFIEYAIIEDRLESALRHGNRWNPKPGEFISINRKVNMVKKMAEQKKSMANRYFSPELMDSILIWKEDRNKMIHALLKQAIHSEDLQIITEKGQELVKILCSKTTSFNRQMDKMENTKKINI